MSEADAERLWQSCLDVPRWVDEVLAGRPYDAAPAVSCTGQDRRRVLLRRGDRRRPGPAPPDRRAAGAGHDAEFSDREQAAVGAADPAITDAIRAGNAEYESRFDRVFVIRAAGRTPTEILAELRRRLSNTAAQERVEVTTQLREIALTRLETVLA